ncbi:MAG TPA: hypothetical protein G4O11_12915 [Anaerolineae bacterium]|nr:hypothetical protein [Anaerolineae bacterium]
MSWDKLLEAIRLDGVNPPVYYLAVKLLTTPFELNEFTLRILSWLAHIVGLICAIAVGYKVGGRIGSLAGGWFWAFHPMTIWYARDARPYALAVMFAAALTLVFITLQRRDSFSAWIGAILIITLGLLTHYFFLVLAISLLVITITDLHHNPLFFRRWTLAALISFVPLALWLIWYFAQPQPSLGIGWLLPPKLIDIPITFWNLLSGFGGLNSWPAKLFGGFALLLLVTALIYDGNKRINRRIFILGIFLPIGVIWLISQRRPIYHDRYFIVLLPMVVILVSSGFESVWYEIKRRFTLRKRRFILGGLVLCAGAIGLFSGLQVHIDEKYTKENWRALTEFLKQDTAVRTSILLSEPEALLPLTYYGVDEIDPNFIEKTSSCDPDCWWILRQPYTATHAFSQAIRQPGRSWEPELPEGCSITDRWENHAGLFSWHVHCRVAEGDGN